MKTWTKEEIEFQIDSGESGVLFLSVPLCGTCQVAERMVTVAQELIPSKVIGKADLNYLPDFAEQIQIESVPCLLFFADQTIIKKIYAFHSVQYIYNEILSFYTERSR